MLDQTTATTLPGRRAAEPGRRGPLDELLEELWAEAARSEDGDVATYIPELAAVDPSAFGLAMATTDGRVYSAGPLATFTIQSVSKPFVYALALADRGIDEVLARVGLEPTGNPFNTISVDGAGRPFNPMVNAGAIVTTSLVGGDTREEQLERVVAGLSAFAGRPLGVDEAVFASERATGDRNRAIGYLLRSVGALDDDVEAVLSAYFRQCAVQVTAADLAVMAATLAGGGVNPVTGETVVPPEVVARVLTVMATCGMYDYAGEWLYRVGLPAKSGVSGGIAAVQPGRLGVGAHSPRLDARGNSVRGIAACELLSDRLGLHVLGPGRPAAGRGHRSARGDAVRSKRVRLAAERAVLDAQGRRVLVQELSGSHDAATVERLVRAVVEETEPTGWLLLDLSRVRGLGAAAVSLLVRLAEHVRAEGVAVAVVPPRSPAVRRAAAALGAAGSVEITDPDAALRWCEDALLAEAGLAAGPPEALLPLADQDLLTGLQPSALAALEAATITRVYPAGSMVFAEGAAADGLYFVAAGEVSAVVRGGGPTARRLSTMGPGSSFGELALVDGSSRSTGIVADEPTLCHVLTRDAFDALVTADPAAGAELHRAIARSLSARLRQATREIAVLDGRG